jgi:hypothetical protein
VRGDGKRLPLGALRAAPVFLVAQGFLLLRLDGERGAATAPLRRHPALAVGNLRRAIRLVFAFSGLPLRLSTVAGLLE